MSGATPEDIELFGDDLIQATQRWAQPLVDGRTAQLEGRINQLQAATNQLQATIGQQRVQATLDADPMLAGKWRALNEDAAFLGWLNQVDGLSGEVRLNLLRRAYDRGDGARVAHFFRAFIAQQTPARQRTEDRLPFEGGSRSKARINAADITPQRLWRREEIAQFYHDCAAGRYDGREAEKLRIEQEIVAAAKERRVLYPPARMADEQ